MSHSFATRDLGCSTTSSSNSNNKTNNKISYNGNDDNNNSNKYRGEYDRSRPRGVGVAGNMVHASRSSPSVTCRNKPRQSVAIIHGYFFGSEDEPSTMCMVGKKQRPL